MSIKLELVKRSEAGEPLSRLCREFGISRTTGHKWLKRFRERGYDGLTELSRRPKSAPLAAAEDVVVATLEVRDEHPRWGPETIHGVLKRRFGSQTPSTRTIARILKRANRVRARKRRGAKSIVEDAPSVVATACNDVWTIDFKGWWRALNGERCEPLTVRDAHSRMVLACVLCSTRGADVRREMERLFRRYGVPKAIQCDNGTPFICARAPAGLTKLSAWWVSLGIQIIRSRPGCPQDNGGHERMHREIAEDVQVAPARSAKAQQRVLDKWRQTFNRVRPHRALNGKTPAEVYVRSGTPMVARPPIYPGENIRQANVSPSGRICVGGVKYFISESVGNFAVGLEPIDDWHARVWFYELELMTIEVIHWVPDAHFATGKRKRSKR